jgi:N-acetylneuraminic acid mutarotase
MKKSRIVSRTCLVAVTSLLLFATTTPVFATPTGSWTTGTSIPVAVEGYGSAQVGNIHYYMGGFSFSGDGNLNQRYDKSTNTWLTNGAPIPGPTRGETAAVATGGFVYLVGGRCPGPCGLLQRYDPTSDSWTPLSPLLVPVVTEHVVAVHDGKIYVAGGRIVTVPGSGGAVNTLQIYDIATDTWIFGTSLPLFLADSAAIAQDSKIFVFGGQTTGVGLPTTLIYDIPSNAWSFGMPMFTARADASVGSCGNKLHVIGGAVTIGVFVSAHEVYNPTTDMWSIDAPIPGGLTGAGTEVQAISQAGRIYIVGGGIFGSGNSDPVQNIWDCARNVHGTVMSGGKPSSDTTVKMFNGPTLVGTSTTDNTGFFLFDVDPGVYTMTVTTATGTSTVIVTVLPGVNLVQNLAT